METEASELEVELGVENASCSLTELHGFLLADDGCRSAGVRLELSRVRGLDTAILVATIGAGSVAFRELVRAAVELARLKHARTVTIRGREGTTLELPASTRQEEIDAWVERARELDPTKLVVR